MRRNHIFGIPIVSIVGVFASLLAGAALIWIVVNQSQSSKAEHTAYILSCKHTNAVAHGLIDDSIDRTRKTLRATLKSPFATAQQKTVAQANLKQLEDYVRDVINPATSNALCVWPPLPIPKIVTPTTKETTP